MGLGGINAKQALGEEGLCLSEESVGLQDVKNQMVYVSKQIEKASPFASEVAKVRLSL